MKLLLLLFLIYNLNLFSQVQIKWYQQEGITSKKLNSVFFLDSLNGWICGDQIILKTTNGGADWTGQNSSIEWNRILFITDSIGFIGGNNAVSKSSDGGLNWYTKYNASYPIFDFYFFDSTNGFAVGGYDVLLKTTDAGETWAEVNIPYMAAVFLDVFFIDDSTGWVAGLEDIGGPIRGLIDRTSDGGNNWTVLNQVYSDPLFRGIHFFDNNHGICVGYNFYKSDNGGVNWSVQSSSPCLVNRLYVRDENNIWVVGAGGGIYNTTDEGLTWISTLNSTDKFIYDVNFITDDLGWAVGEQGLVLTTNNMVVSVSDEISPATLPMLLQNYPNPFNPVTNIQYSVGSMQFVTLKVYDVLGNEVAALVNEEKSGGSYSVQLNGSGLPSGVYIYRLVAGNFSISRKLMILK